MNGAFPKWRKDFPEIAGVHSQILQNISLRVELAFSAFFRLSAAVSTRTKTERRRSTANCSGATTSRRERPRASTMSRSGRAGRVGSYVKCWVTASRCSEAVSRSQECPGRAGRARKALRRYCCDFFDGRVSKSQGVYGLPPANPARPPRRPFRPRRRNGRSRCTLPFPRRLLDHQ